MIVAILPVGAILFIGAGLWAPERCGTCPGLVCRTSVGTAATIFIAAPLYAWLRQGEPDLVGQPRAYTSAGPRPRPTLPVAPATA